MKSTKLGYNYLSDLDWITFNVKTDKTTYSNNQYHTTDYLPSNTYTFSLSFLLDFILILPFWLYYSISKFVFLSTSIYFDTLISNYQIILKIFYLQIPGKIRHNLLCTGGIGKFQIAFPVLLISKRKKKKPSGLPMRRIKSHMEIKYVPFCRAFYLFHFYTLFHTCLLYIYACPVYFNYTNRFNSIC